VNAASSLISLRSSSAYAWRLPITVVAVTAGWLTALFTEPWLVDGTPLDHWADLSGAILLIAGCAVRAWSIHEIGGRKRKMVVDTGPYALCRNPLYLGTLLIGVSPVCFLKSGWYLLLLLPVIALYLWGVVPAEERYLRQRLGTAYEEYCRITPRWLPRYSSRMWQPSGESPRGPFWAELRCQACWVLLPVLTELTCRLRALEDFQALVTAL
jgi:protein-S-isoprenylcysteine O-methyltransferase Ste14